METVALISVAAVGLYLWSASNVHHGHKKKHHKKQERPGENGSGEPPVPPTPWTPVGPMPTPPTPWTPVGPSDGPPNPPLHGSMTVGVFVFQAQQAHQYGKQWKVEKWPSGEAPDSFYYKRIDHNHWTVTTTHEEKRQVEVAVKITKSWSE